MWKQSSYDAVITVEVKGSGESGSWNHPFGFRKIESYIDKATGGRLFKVNGQPICIHGGNWISSDGLLQLSGNRYQVSCRHKLQHGLMLGRWIGYEAIILSLL